MKMSSKGCLLSILCLVGHHASAGSPSPVDTITCIRLDGSTLKHNVYAFTLDTSLSSGAGYSTVYFSENLFPTFLYENDFSNAYSSCAFGKLPGFSMGTVNIIDVSTAGVGANVGTVSIQQDSVSQAYTEVTFQFTSFAFGFNTQTPTLPVGSKEEQAKALAAFKARGLALPK